MFYDDKLAQTRIKWLFLYTSFVSLFIICRVLLEVEDLIICSLKNG